MWKFYNPNHDEKQPKQSISIPKLLLHNKANAILVTKYTNKI